MLHQRLPRPRHRGVSGWCQSSIQFAHGPCWHCWPWSMALEMALSSHFFTGFHWAQGAERCGFCAPNDSMISMRQVWCQVTQDLYTFFMLTYLYSTIYSSLFIYIYILFIRPMVYNRRLHFWRGNRGEFGWQILRGHLGHGYPRTLDTGDAGKGGQMQICAAQAVTCQVSWFSLAAHPADHPDHWATEKDPQRK